MFEKVSLSLGATVNNTLVYLVPEKSVRCLQGGIKMFQVLKQPLDVDGMSCIVGRVLLLPDENHCIRACSATGANLGRRVTRSRNEQKCSKISTY